MTELMYLQIAASPSAAEDVRVEAIRRLGGSDALDVWEGIYALANDHDLPPAVAHAAGAALAHMAHRVRTPEYDIHGQNEDFILRDMSPAAYEAYDRTAAELEKMPRPREWAGNAQDAFKLFLKEHVAPALRALGLLGSGQVYELPSATHWALIGFQRSQYSDRFVIRFTINVSTVPRTTWDEYAAANPRAGKRPAPNIRYGTVMRGRWEQRIGSLVPEWQDKWWDLERDTDTGALAADVIAMVRDYALPAMRTQIG